MNDDAHSRLQRYAGVITWATITGALLYVLRGRDDYGDLWPPLVALALVYAVAAALAVQLDGRRDRRALALAGLAVAAVAVFAIGWLVPVGFVAIYTIVLLAILPSFAGFAVCLVALAVVLFTWYGIFAWHWGDGGALLSTFLFGTFHLFAVLSARATQAAEVAQQRAEALNRELAATQHLLSEAARQSERTRIARDLHDVVGHHLTALTINLQIAERLSDGAAHQRIQQSHALARLLLADVRDAVSALRESSAVDFEAALRLIVERIPRLDIRLDIDPTVEVTDVAIAEPLLRCVQEALTNTLRHSSARTTTIRMARVDDSIALSIVDDGGSVTDPAFGNGLTGMRERIEQIRGTLDIVRAVDSFAIHVRVPSAL